MSSFTYERRLATFNHFNWPHSLNKTGNKEKFKSQPEDFAQAGFYCRPLVGSEDTVACFLCLKSLDGWERTDIAWQEHKSHSTTCPLVTLNLTASRLRTFDKWSGARVKGGAAALAEAGFFHFPKTDSDDTCICFQCGLALDGWEIDDDPFHEHSRRRPNCPWVARHEFIHPASFEFILAGKSDDLAVKDISHVPKIKIVQTPRRTPSKTTRDISQTPSRKTSNIDISRTPSRKTIKISSVISATPQSKIPILSELQRLFPHTKQEEVLNWTMQDLIDRLIREKVDKFDQFLKGQ